MLDRVASLRVAVGAAEVEEVLVEERELILGEVGWLDGDRGKTLRLRKPVLSLRDLTLTVLPPQPRRAACNLGTSRRWPTCSHSRTRTRLSAYLGDARR